MLLDDLMDQSGLNGNALAAAIGVKPTSISGWRHGRDLPDGGSMQQIVGVLRGRITEANVKLLLRAWMELRLGSMASLAWENPEDVAARENAEAGMFDKLLWRWTPAEREDIRRLLDTADKQLAVRETLVSLARCLPGKSKRRS